MERRTLIAIALSFLVLYGYQYFFVPREEAPGPRPQTSGQVQEDQASGVRPQAPESAPQQTAASPAPAAPPAVDGPAPLISGTSSGDADAVMDTPTLRATFSSRGARLTHWQLKQYAGDNGQPVDLIPSNLPADQPSPFTLRVDDAELTRRLNAAVYRVTTTDGAQPTVTFEFQDAAGLHVRKDFRVDPATYVLTFSASVTNNGQALNPTVLWGPGLGDIGAVSGGGSMFTGNYVQPPQAMVNLGGDVTRLPVDDIAEQPVQEGNFKFVGIDDHYFLAAALDPGQVRAEFRPLALTSDAGQTRQLITQTLRFAQPPQNARFFIGPKKDDILRSIDIELVKSINFGIFAWLVRPLLTGLNWIYAYVGNYGWSIIILTVVITALMFPLRHKSMVSMRRMQVLQPKIKAIQDRYKDLKFSDPMKQKGQTEVMNLYREEGINPAAGCVPMLLTMPVLFALFSLLGQAIELRGAPFILWIHDLTQKDPYYVTPLLTGASMFLQMRSAPAAGDPQQQKMMAVMMPVVFTFMFLNLPSGLGIYYFVSNVLSIGQQYLTNRMLPLPATSAPRPPAERKLKNVGSGKTPDAQKP
jgi:YidC/Oxa1 family membrane protein insertase